MHGKDQIREFIRNKLISIGDPDPASDGDSLLFTGRLQSIDAVDIVIFLEENFGIDFATIGFDQERIDSIEAIYALVISESSQR